MIAIIVPTISIEPNKYQFEANNSLIQMFWMEYRIWIVVLTFSQGFFIQISIAILCAKAWAQCVTLKMLVV